MFPDSLAFARNRVTTATWVDQSGRTAEYADDSTTMMPTALDLCFLISVVDACGLGIVRNSPFRFG
ncbi:hypothetical protein F3P66_24475 (plasmid) [Agrobacterium fabrum]|uniref:Uncharacterized protein n=1 Tax=Agrobacterium fabrum (strain C58 / ATCC 33970) TaxID=176299 RepID=Q8UJK8_AGRFC|nr:hypothetical protein Atu5468 [Agrobacterium fabrum str. C58]QKX00656.1 hypothetical protein GSF67_26285 [Agrobacterium sp. CGMCC 11546]QRM62557.1 hypothetical protein F3P66_24475 [Agrobacterium fabrum]TRB22694.1 hypothetical protein EXN51_25925 [Agrobacterium fabrum]